MQLIITQPTTPELEAAADLCIASSVYLRSHGLRAYTDLIRSYCEIPADLIFELWDSCATVDGLDLSPNDYKLPPPWDIN